MPDRQAEHPGVSDNNDDLNRFHLPIPAVVRARCAKQ